MKLLVGPSLGAPCANRLLLFDATGCRFHQIKLRGRRSDCPACGAAPTITHLLDDYDTFCGVGACGAGGGVNEGHRIDCATLEALVTSDKKVVVLDVRPPVHFGICRIPGSINVPLPELTKKDDKWLQDQTGGGAQVGTSCGNENVPV